MSVVLSNRQLPMLEALAGTDYMKIDEAQQFDQRPFRSMLIREYAAYTPGKGFHITSKGRDARKTFYETDIVRKNPTLPLTAYFDPAAYGLAAPKKKKPKAMKAPRGPAPAKRDNVREFIRRQKGAA